MTRRSVAVLVGVGVALCVAGSAAAGPMIPATPPTLHCHTPWQFPRYVNGQWECLGGHGPVITPGIYH